MAEHSSLAEQLARASALEEAGELEEAARALDAALATDPNAQAALDARARIALQRAEPGAAPIVMRSLAARDDDPELQLQMIMSAAVQIGAEAIPMLHAFVRRHPGSIEAQERLAEMRAEAGEGERFADAFAEALRDRPRDVALHLSHWRTLARAERYDEALRAIDSARPQLGEEREAQLLELAISSQAGLLDRAEALLGRLGDSEDTLAARGKHCLQTGELRDAANLLEAAVRANPHDLALWAMLSVAWRATGHPWHHWLCEQPGLWQTHELGLSGAELTALAGRLRELHRSHSHPIGQSLRGGTQTAGDLFMRPEPEIRRLQSALAEAVQAHMSALPPPDPQHPLLRHLSGTIGFGASWSVRLTQGGFHVAHVHPAGILSSACYISLPEGMGTQDPLEGALELGRPPAELRVDLPPLATVRPETGKLTLFPSYLFHGTRPFGSGERLTVAFDLIRL